MTKISSHILEKLRTIDTPTVCNLVEHFNLRPYNTGYMDASIKACFPEMPPMVGFALTLTFRSSSSPPENTALTLADLAVEIENMINKQEELIEDIENSEDDYILDKK